MLPLGGDPRRVRVANRGMAGIDLGRFPGLGVDQPRDPDVGKVALARIFYGDRDDVVPLRQQLERMVDIPLEKIRHDEHDRLVIQHFGYIVDRRHHVRPGTHWLEREQVADDSQHVPSALSRRNHVLDPIRKEKNTNPVVVAHR